jgi:hypothetical protein
MTEIQWVEKRDEKSAEEKREVKKAEERREQIKQAEVSEPSKESLKIKTKAPLLSIPLEVVTPSRTPSILTLHVSVIPCIFAKLDIISARAIQSSILTPKLKVLQKLPRDIKVQVYEPLRIAEVTCPSLVFKPKPPENWSIRPLIEPITIADLGLYNPYFAYRLKRLRGLEILSAPALKSNEICMPRMWLEQQEIKHATGGMLQEQMKKPQAEPVVEFSSLLEYLLEMRYLSDEYHKLGGLGGVGDEGLICILVDKSRDFHEFIKHICKEMWRIKSKGLPSVSDKGWEELRWHGLHEDVIELDKAQQMIEDLSKKRANTSAFNEAEDAFIKEVKSRSVEGRLRFLLLPVEGSKFKESYEILIDPRIRIERYVKYSKFFAFKLRMDLEEELLAKILSAIFGFAKVSLHSHSIGQYTLELYGEFRQKLDEIITRVRKEVSCVRWPKHHSEECRLHWALKHLAYAHLLFNERIGEEYIDSEFKVDEIKTVDVYCNNPARKIAFEIETMYGTGDPIGAKINHETIIPYYEKRWKFDSALWLVIPNLQAFLFIRELLRIRRYYREQGLKLEIYVADVTGEGAKQIYGEKKAPGLIRLIDLLNFIGGKSIDVNSRFEMDY